MIQSYEKNGWVGPLQLMSREEALHYKQLVIEVDNKHNLMKSDYRCKSNVLFPFVDELTRNPKLISYVSQLIGPNFHCWDTLFWIKKANTLNDVSFHQDSTYWNFDQPEKALTVWFAFDDVTEQHGPIQYVNKSITHALHHVDIKTDTNLLMRGQTVGDLVHGEIVSAICPVGHALIHGPFTVHGSGPNNTNTDRIALGMVFVSTECKPIRTDSPESTMMIWGGDTYNHMLHDPRPTGDWDIDVKNWQKAYDRQHINYYKMKQRAEHV